MPEQKMLKEYADARKQVADLTVQLDDAKERRNNAEERLLKFMDDKGIKATAKYDGIGRLTIIAPMLRVSIEEGKDAEAFEYLRSSGEADSIKQSVNWKTLASIMKAKVEANEPLPDCFTYYFQQQSRFEA